MALKELVTMTSSSIYLIKDEGTVQQTPSTTCSLIQSDKFINPGNFVALVTKEGETVSRGRESERERTVKGDHCRALRSKEWGERNV